MQMPADSKKQHAFRKAQDQFARSAQRESTFREERAKAQATDAAKTARLRALRLAKEAADREAAEAEDLTATAGKKPARPRKPKMIKISIAS